MKRQKKKRPMRRRPQARDMVTCDDCGRFVLLQTECDPCHLCGMWMCMECLFGHICEKQPPPDTVIAPHLLTQRVTARKAVMLRRLNEAKRDNKA